MALQLIGAIFKLALAVMALATAIATAATVVDGIFNKEAAV